MYPPSVTVQQDSINETKLLVKNTAENWKREFLFDNGKCLVEKFYFPRDQKKQWMEKLKAEGWKYNKLWHWYFLKKGNAKYYAEFLLNDWDLNYLLFEIKSAGWMDEGH